MFFVGYLFILVQSCPNVDFNTRYWF